ncbi:MAG: hypothetical protein EHM21_18485, partial [Chloroflexi bacterium]
MGQPHPGSGRTALQDAPRVFLSLVVILFLLSSLAGPTPVTAAVLHPVESIPSPLEPIAGIRTASLQEGVRFEQAECMFSVPTGMTEGKDVECGWLTVPEQYE